MTVLMFYTVLGYEVSTPDMNFIDTAKVIVLAESEEQALEKAKKLVTKKAYKVTQVEEFLYDHRLDEKPSYNNPQNHSLLNSGNV